MAKPTNGARLRTNTRMELEVKNVIEGKISRRHREASNYNVNI